MNLEEKKDPLTAIKVIVAEQLSIDPDKINPSSKIADDLEADSLDMVEIILCLEEEFDIAISDAEATKINTVQEAMDIISKKVSEK